MQVWKLSKPIVFLIALSLPAVLVRMYWQPHVVTRAMDSVLTRQATVEQQQQQRPQQQRQQEKEEEEEEETNKQPKMIVHIGPHKTGTSTIQSVLTQLDFNYDILHHDNLYYMGKLAGTERRKGFQNISRYSNDNYATTLKFLCLTAILKGSPDELPERCVQETQRMKDKVKEHHDLGHDIIISDEDLETNIKYVWVEGPRDRAAKLKQHFLPILGNYADNLHVMFVYRRFYDWHFSRYKQHGEYILEAMTRPNDKGWNHPDIQKGYESYKTAVAKQFKEDPQKHTFRFNPLYFHKELPKYLHESQITMINLYETDDFVTDFICDILPIQNNTHSCQFVKQHRDYFKNANTRQAEDIHYATIAREAHLRYGEKITSCYSPNDLFTEIYNFHRSQLSKDNTSNFLHLTICLSQEQQDWLLNQSIQDESQLFPDYHYHGGGKQAIETNFQKAIEERKFCDVDQESLFSDTDWKQFFHQRIQTCTEDNS